MSTNKATSLPTSASEVTQPVAGAIMHKGYVKTIGRMAYVWGWPLGISSIAERRLPRHQRLDG